MRNRAFPLTRRGQNFPLVWKEGGKMACGCPALEIQPCL